MRGENLPLPLDSLVPWVGPGAPSPVGLGRMEDLVSDWLTCSEALSAGVQLDLQALTFALEFKQSSLYWLYWRGSARDTAGCVLLLAPALPRSLCLPASGSASPKEQFGGKGLVFKVLCVRFQPGAVNSVCGFAQRKYRATAGSVFPLRQGLETSWHVGLGCWELQLWEESLCVEHME